VEGFDLFLFFEGIAVVVDGWVRMRLGGILRKREKRRGVGRGLDHRRWPNVFFARVGLFSLERAWRVASQSMKMAH